jgi:hypothetical protein
MSDPYGVKALRLRLLEGKKEIMRTLGLTESPPKKRATTHKARSHTKTRTSSSERLRRAESRAAREQREAAEKGIKRQRLHPNMRLLQEAGLPIPERSRVGAFRVRLEAPGHRRTTSKRRD